MSYQGTFKLFEPSFAAFMAEWIDNCSVNEYCECVTIQVPALTLTPSTVDWHLFGKLVQAAVVLLNDAASSVGALVSQNISDLLPAFSGRDVADNE